MKQETLKKGYEVSVNLEAAKAENARAHNNLYNGEIPRCLKRGQDPMVREQLIFSEEEKEQILQAFEDIIMLRLEPKIKKLEGDFEAIKD